MPEPAHGRRFRQSRRLGDDALHFARWFTKSKFQLMADFMADLECSPSQRDAEALARRFQAAIRHARRVLLARLAVTILLAAGVIATMGATLAQFLAVPAEALGFLDRVAAVSASATVALVVARLGFDRYLGLVETSATFLAMQIATTRCAPR
jgi:hypothetical protein